MARGKKGGPRAKLRGIVRSGQGNLRDSFIPSTGNGVRSDLPRTRTSTPGSHHDFERSYLSLRDEARNTERHYFSGSALKLRHSQVSFISGGDLDATEPCTKQGKDVVVTKGHPSGPSVHPDSAFAEMKLHEEECIMYEDSANSQVKVVLSDTGKDRMPGAAVLPAAREHGFIVDTVGSSMTIDTGLPPPVIRSSSPPDDSSDEVIVFAGRNQVRVKKGSRTMHCAGGKAGWGRQDTASVNIRPAGSHELNGTNKSTQQKLNPSASSTVGRLVPQENHTEPRAIPLIAVRPLEFAEHSAVDKTISTDSSTQRKSREQSMNEERRKKSKKKTTFTGERTRAKQVDEAILADYIANMSDNMDLNGRLTSTPLDGTEMGGTDTDDWRDETGGSSSECHAKSKPEKGSALKSLGVDDSDDLSTSDEVIGKVQAVLSKRDRPSGLQYLIVCEGSTVDDARWVPHASLEGESALNIIRLFEKEEEFVRRYSAGGGDMDEYLDDDHTQESGSDDEAEALRDEEDLLRRNISRMTDGKIARLLAKQEELGIGSDELLLFDDGDLDDGGDSNAMENEHNSSLTQVLRPVHRRTRGSKRPKSDYSPASVFVDLMDQDPYYGFDIIDRDRPSLSKKAKGRQGLRAFDLSDSDLELSLSVAWHNDRTKKKARKQQREELRSQGLLGKKNKNKADLKAKYSEGITIDQVKDEIRDFLLSNNESLPLPPMDKIDRKLVHEIANDFSLKSKSVGNGRSRFPVLYKTSRTGIFKTDALGLIESRLNRRRFMPRMEKRGKKSSFIPKKGGGGGSVGAAFSYQDGEVVGASAPELGTENKGRAMLEKMGWSTGTALGAMNNKGILQPVVHIVKTTKAGLG